MAPHHVLARELDLVRVEAAHCRYGQLTAGRAGRVGLTHRFDAGVQRSVFGMYLSQGGGGRRGRYVAVWSGPGFSVRLPGRP
jgi:hypothetical protein